MSIDITNELEQDTSDSAPNGSVHETISWRTLSWLLIGILLCASAFILPEQASVPVTSTAASDAIAIEDVQLGWRVVGENPNGPESFDGEPNEATWKKVVLHGTAENGTAVEVEFLRSPEWIANNNAIVGQTIDLELSEGHLSGVAKVVSLDACPEIKPGNGPVVTGLFRHRCKADELVRVTVDANIPPIIGTYNHPFWSETRQDFVNAEDLKLGEKLRCVDDSVVHVVSVERVNGAKPVFNLETHNHHVYAVGNVGMLVHNMYGRKGERVRRFSSKAKTKDLKKNGIKFDSERGNGIPTTSTNIDPVDPDAIRKLTGARNADAFADIDIEGLPVQRTTTKNGNIEIRVQVDIEPSRVLGTGRVQKNRQSR